MKTLLVLFGWGVFYAFGSAILASLPYRTDVMLLAGWSGILVVLPFLVGAFTALSGQFLVGPADTDFWKFRAAGWAAFLGCLGFVLFLVWKVGLIIIAWLVFMLAALPITMMAAHLGGYLAICLVETRLQ